VAAVGRLVVLVSHRAWTLRGGGSGVVLGGAGFPGPAAGVAKIASIGLKPSHGFSYHGLALNGQMDLSPFHRINPCGFRNLQMTDIHRQAALSQDLDLDALALALGKALAAAIEG